MKRTGIFLALAGAGWVSYQVHHAFHHFYNIIPSGGVKLEPQIPEYIYYQPQFSGRAHFEALWLPQYVWWWKSVPSSLAWRLLHVAKKGNHRQRLKAVHSLALLENLEDSDYCQIAQACDPRTAVGLARTKDVDLRFFLKPPNHPAPVKKEDLIDSCHEILIRLNNKEAHECVRYFISDVLPEVQENHSRYSSRINQEYLLILCLKSILHLSNLPSHSNEIVKQGGLKLFMDIYYHYPDTMDIVGLLAKIISNIAEPKYCRQMFSSGWVGVLANWMSSRNIIIRSPAGKALANLDEDDQTHSTYGSGVYLLHPLYRNRTNVSLRNIKADVVFVHGLLGGVFWTWRNRDRVRIDFSNFADEFPDVDDEDDGQLGMKIYEGIYEGLLNMKSPMNIRSARQVLCDCPVGVKRQENEKLLDTSACEDGSHPVCPAKDVTQCWPVDWLPKDLPSVRVIGLNYDTFISMWMPVCPEETLHTSLEARSQEFIKKLHMAGIGKRPIIWVAHSMGGLIVKNILVKAFESDDVQLKALCENSKAAVFYSVPHFGSQLATLKQATKMLLLPSNEVSELGYNSPELLNLHERFLKLLKKFPLRILSFTETESTTVTSLKLQLRFVTSESADPGVGEFFEIPLNHLDICKPTNRKSFLYQKLLVFLEKILEQDIK